MTHHQLKYARPMPITASPDARVRVCITRRGGCQDDFLS
jgi:hypothetical protein